MDAQALTRPRAPRRARLARERRRRRTVDRRCSPRVSSAQFEAPAAPVEERSRSYVDEHRAQHRWSTAPATSRALRRAALGGRALRAALRLRRLHRAAGGVPRRLHGAGESAGRRYQQRIRDARSTSKRGALTRRSRSRASSSPASSRAASTELARDLDDATLDVGRRSCSQHAEQHLRRRRAALVTRSPRTSPTRCSTSSKRVHLVSTASAACMREQVRGGAQRRRDHRDQLRALRQGDAAPACAHAQRRAARRSVVITDSRMAPLARDASALLVVPESSAFAFRSLTSTICLCAGAVRRARLPARARRRGNEGPRRRR